MKLRNRQITVKLICIIVMYIIIAGCKQPVNADQNSIANAQVLGGFRLLLSAEPTSTTSEAVICRVTLKNVSNQILYFPDSYPLANYRFMVKDEVGKTVSLTHFGHDHEISLIFRNVRSMLNPGQSISVDFPLNRIYDMTKSGTYIISVSRDVFQKDGNEFEDSIVTSNTIQIERKTTVIEDISVKPDNQENLPINHAIPPSDQWQVGDHWKIIVNVFRNDTPMTMKEPVDEYLTPGEEFPGKGMHVLENYAMEVKVTDIQKVGAIEQVKLEFTPSEDAPSFVQGRTFDLVLNRASHQLLEAHVSDHSDRDFMSTFDKQHVIVFPINGYSVGFPVDIIPQIDNATQATLSTPYKDMLLSLTKSMIDDTQKIQESLSAKGKDWFRITQIWPTGSKWWSQYLKEDFDSQFGMLATTVGNSEIHWGAVENGLQLGISSDDTPAQGGAPVRVHVAVRNTLDQSVPVPSLFWGQLQVHMLDNNGTPVSLTELGKTIQAASSVFLSAKTIPPHSVLSGDISIDKIYDLSRAGIYLVSASAGNSLEEAQPLNTPSLTIQVKNNDLSESAGK